jgi:hypothetical protein
MNTQPTKLSANGRYSVWFVYYSILFSGLLIGAYASRSGDYFRMAFGALSVVAVYVLYRARSNARRDEWKGS